MSLRFEPVDPQTPELEALMFGPVLLTALADGEVRFAGDPRRPDLWIHRHARAPLDFQAADGRLFRPFYLLHDER